ncbi:hypothetical protein EVAR_31057_1 [Eumeta japonica]|uniref:Uncharacterized protein n=1 Tax=Eumeta variegata TaxID=151549 RepID=A0A4C1VEM4_EUMVA|nr:hypothetical protein EVAR_31057_1 [Eumeta japonica]
MWTPLAIIWLAASQQSQFTRRKAFKLFNPIFSLEIYSRTSDIYTEGAKATSLLKMFKRQNDTSTGTFRTIDDRLSEARVFQIIVRGRHVNESRFDNGFIDPHRTCVIILCRCRISRFQVTWTRGKSQLSRSAAEHSTALFEEPIMLLA